MLREEKEKFLFFVVKNFSFVDYDTLGVPLNLINETQTKAHDKHNKLSPRHFSLLDFLHGALST